jgi:ribosomal protein S18 acetylase RimI-like enzyme
MKYRLFETSDIMEVLTFIEMLRSEGTDISFVDERESDLVLWNHGPKIVVLAIDQGQIVGMAKGKIGVESKNHSAMLTAAIDKDYRGTGIAAVLTDHLNKSLAERGVTIVRAYVYSDNKASVKTIEKQRFTLSGRVLMHHREAETGHYVDDLIYHKLIRKE